MVCPEDKSWRRRREHRQCQRRGLDRFCAHRQILRKADDYHARRPGERRAIISLGRTRYQSSTLLQRVVLLPAKLFANLVLEPDGVEIQACRFWSQGQRSFLQFRSRRPGWRGDVLLLERQPSEHHLWSDFANAHAYSSRQVGARRGFLQVRWQ